MAAEFLSRVIPARDRMRTMPGGLVRPYVAPPSRIRGEGRLTKDVWFREFRQWLDEGEVVAHFSKEYYDCDGLPGAGGLGTLSADWLRGSIGRARVLAVTIANHRLHTQRFDPAAVKGEEEENGNGRPKYFQEDVFLPLDLDAHPDIADLDLSVGVVIQGQNIPCAVYGQIIEDGEGGRTFKILLSARKCGVKGFGRITADVYPGDRDAFATFGSEMALGTGGIRALRKLGVTDDKVAVYHVNDAHSVLLLTELARERGITADTLDETNLRHLGKRIAYSSHTLAGAKEAFLAEDVSDLIQDRDERLLVGRLGTSGTSGLLRDVDDPRILLEPVVLTDMALRTALRIEAVSHENAELLKAAYKDCASRIGNGITNAVHPSKVSPPIAAFFDKYAPGWRKNPSLLIGLRKYRDDVEFRQALWQARLFAQQDLIDLVGLMRQEVAQAGFDPDIFARPLKPDWLTFGFARRWPRYKRGNLMWKDPDALAALFSPERPGQFVSAGKAHQHDGKKGFGKYMLAEALEAMEYLNTRYADRINAVFLPNYDVNLARVIIPGVHAWVNLPLWSQEASGTSPMVAIANLVLLISILDGCVPEMDKLGNVGWPFGRRTPGGSHEHMVEDFNALMYGVLPMVINEYYRSQEAGAFESGAPSLWVDRQIGLCDVIPYFLTPRMVDEYVRLLWYRQ